MENFREYDLGLETEFASFPTEIQVQGADFFLTKNGDKYFLLSRICPHSGGAVRNQGKFLFCPVHMWRFHANTGECLNEPKHCLERISISVRDGHLIAVL